MVWELPEQRPRFLDSVGFRETDSIVFDGKVLRGNHGAHDFPHPQWGFIFSRKFREPVPPGRRMLWRFREPAQEKRVEIGILQKLKIMRAQERIIELACAVGGGAGHFQIGGGEILFERAGIVPCF